MRRLGALLRFLLLVACVGGLCYSGWQLWDICRTYQQGTALYEELASVAVAEAEEEEGDAGTDSARQGEEEAASPQQTPLPQGPGITVDFDILAEMSPNVLGWLYCPDTVINYPVVQGSDNDYYLTHLLDGTENKNGTLFVDARNRADLTDGNTVIYGHHMKNGAMFASLEEYRDQAYYQAHPVLYYLTPEQNYRLRVFAAFVTDAESEVYQRTFSDEEERADWLSRQIASSDIDAGVAVGEADKIVTLSTCAYDFAEARYVVLAVLEPVS